MKHLTAIVLLGLSLSACGPQPLYQPQFETCYNFKTEETMTYDVKQAKTNGLFHPTLEFTDTEGYQRVVTYETIGDWKCRPTK